MKNEKKDKISQVHLFWSWQVYILAMKKWVRKYKDISTSI